MGQMLDLNGEHQQLSQTALEAIHRDKTGALIEAAVLMGAICANATDSERQALNSFAERTGCGRETSNYFFLNPANKPSWLIFGIFMVTVFDSKSCSAKPCLLTHANQ